MMSFYPFHFIYGFNVRSALLPYLVWWRKSNPRLSIFGVLYAFINYIEQFFNY